VRVENEEMKKLAVVVSSEVTVKAFLVGHIAALSRHYDVSVVVNTSDAAFLKPFGIQPRVFPVPIERRPRPDRDLAALRILVHLFRGERFDVVYSVTPKAGLLAMLAGFLAGVPVRIHTFTGQVWATRHGPRRSLLKNADRLLAALATHILVDSPSQRDFLIAERVLSAAKAEVLADGSISGVDTLRFRPDVQTRAAKRAELGYGEQDVVFLFLGRLNRDKGVLDLADAFASASRQASTARLLVIGRDEEELRSEMERRCADCLDRVRFVDHVDSPERYMAAADVFCLPSYREGFGSVIIEAASCGIPTLGSRIYGVTDAIAEGETGWLHPRGDSAALAALLVRCIREPSLIREMGSKARLRAEERFSQARVVHALETYLLRVAPPAIGVGR
jgi:glycosyltransferase involved in cell wall biosynthesis